LSSGGVARVRSTLVKKINPVDPYSTRLDSNFSQS